jgi:3-hydroxyethyl bacteriochlorophyllide a dehydrogenase
MNTLAIVLQAPRELRLDRVGLNPPGAEDVVVDVEWSGVSAGTERLLWDGRMPMFPGMGYPLVPGYESVGTIVDAGSSAKNLIGQRAFVPGANCYTDVRGLFGGAARRLVTSANRIALIGDECASHEGVLLALAATAQHALAATNARAPELIIGHGALGRLLARLTIAQGHAAPTVWEVDPARRIGDFGYAVIDPAQDERRDYTSIYDASGDAALIDTLISRVARGGEIVLAGFYDERPSFNFVPAFMREICLRVAAEWQPQDLADVQRLLTSGALSLSGLITHRREAAAADEAYRTAFEDSSCLKMVLDWRTCQ